MTRSFGNLKPSVGLPASGVSGTEAISYSVQDILSQEGKGISTLVKLILCQESRFVIWLDHFRRKLVRPNKRLDTRVHIIFIMIVIECNILKIKAH